MPDLSLQLEGSSLWLILLSSAKINSQLRGSHQVVSLLVLSRHEFKQNNHHLLSIKMRPSDSLKAYIGYFQNQLVKVHNCNDDASTLAFINRLRVTYSLYNHMVKYNIICWCEVLYQAQPYIQLRKQ